ncbi:MAG: hypothetical protein EOP10_31785, partial [Proteobacteria bacterium]
MRRLILLFLLLLVPFGAFTSPARADAPSSEKFEGLLNKLLAPGPLALGHDNLEHTSCLKCHEPAGGIPNRLCIDCHKKIGEHVDSKTHFHGLMNGKACIDCHKEHKGRDANISFFDKKTFDHERTGFKLDGGHSKVECTKCHTDTREKKPSRKNETEFFGSKASCIGCHAKDDIHFFETNKFKGKECSTCHVTESWKDVKKFDHTRETGYALVGDHASLK